MSAAGPERGDAPPADLNGDLSVPVVLRARAMDWTRSPAAGVERKRFHRVGAPESGQVTSLVRYLPGARFAGHAHPEGEEILVLEGVFSDEHGDWPAGTWLANPEGFEHAPFSVDGCLLFVKLRQYPGMRPRVALRADLSMGPGPDGGAESRALLVDERFPERTTLERWPKGSVLDLDASLGLEMFLISGALVLDAEDGSESLEAQAFVRLPPAHGVRVRCTDHCLVWLKRDGFGVLRGATGASA